MALNHYTRLQGQSGLERRLDAIREDLHKLRICESSTVKVEQTTRGQILTVRKTSSAAGSSVTQYRLKSVQNDYLVCRLFDGTTEGDDDVSIAKPFELRYTGWHGVTITYPLESVIGTSQAVTYSYQTSTYRIANTTEHQGIRPIYVPNQSIIYAASVTNGTGVSDTTGEISLIDLNVAGRAWAKIA